eukprot:2014226-Pyramimonas_sp.AAC.1
MAGKSTSFTLNGPCTARVAISASRFSHAILSSSASLEDLTASTILTFRSGASLSHSARSTCGFLSVTLHTPATYAGRGAVPRCIAGNEGTAVCLRGRRNGE